VAPGSITANQDRERPRNAESHARTRTARFWLLQGEPAKREFTTSLEHVAIIGGLVLVIVESLRTG
jgi:hypothetical protein